MRCILSHKPFLPKIVIFLFPGGVHCAVLDEIPVKVPDFVDEDDPEAAAPKARLAPSTVFNKIR